MKSCVFNPNKQTVRHSGDELLDSLLRHQTKIDAIQLSNVQTFS